MTPPSLAASVSSRRLADTIEDADDGRFMTLTERVSRHLRNRASTPENPNTSPRESVSHETPSLAASVNHLCVELVVPWPVLRSPRGVSALARAQMATDSDHHL